MTAEQRERWGLSTWGKRGRTKRLHCSETTSTRLTLLPFLLSLPLLSSSIHWCSSGSSITNLWQKKISSLWGSAVPAWLWENTPFSPRYCCVHSSRPQPSHKALPPPPFHPSYISKTGISSLTPPLHRMIFLHAAMTGQFFGIHPFTTSPLSSSTGLSLCRSHIHTHSYTPPRFWILLNLTSPSIVSGLKNNHSSPLTYHNPHADPLSQSPHSPPFPLLLALTPCYPPQETNPHPLSTLQHSSIFTGIHDNIRSIWIFREAWCSVNCFLLAPFASLTVANCSYGCCIITMQWERRI